MNGREPTMCSLEKEKDEYIRMQLALLVYKPRAVVEIAMLDAYNAKDWDWEKCDGCTGVSEMNSPKGMKYWPCVLHDHWCWKAWREDDLQKRDDVRRRGDELFLWAMLDYQANPVRAYARWAYVRSRWVVWGRMWDEPESSKQCSR